MAQHGSLASNLAILQGLARNTGFGANVLATKESKREEKQRERVLRRLGKRTAERDLLNIGLSLLKFVPGGAFIAPAASAALTAGHKKFVTDKLLKKLPGAGLFNVQEDRALNRDIRSGQKGQFLGDLLKNAFIASKLPGAIGQTVGKVAPNLAANLGSFSEIRNIDDLKVFMEFLQSASPNFTTQAASSSLDAFSSFTIGRE